MSQHVRRRDRIEGALLGLLVGDALGVPYEFSAPHLIPASEAIEIDPPAGFRRAHSRVLPGTWSDDGAQALCVLSSLLDCGRLDVDDLAQRLVAWYRDGYMAVDGIVFDIGIQTETAIHRLIENVHPAESGLDDEQANGNGSLMRVMPLALWHRGSNASLVDDAHAQSAMTHRHPRAQVCCALYCLWARSILEERSDPWENAVETLRAIYGDSRFRAELEAHVIPAEDRPVRGSGYVVDTLLAARHVAGETSYERAVRAAIALGYDTDTTACVAGGIAGAMWGVGSIPNRWLDRLRGRDLVEPLLARLVARTSDVP